MQKKSLISRCYPNVRWWRGILFVSTFTTQRATDELAMLMITIWGFPSMGIPKIGCFFWEHPTKMDELGVPLFQETSICGFVGDPQPWDSSNWRPPGWHGRGPLVGRGGPRCERHGQITIGEALAKWEWVKTLQSLRFSMYDMKDEQSSPAISMWKAKFPGYPHRLIYLIHGLVNGLISATNGRISHLAQTLRALLQGIGKVSHSILGMASFDL